MSVKEAPLEVLPDPGLLIGDQRVSDASGGATGHVYAATGNVTARIPLGGAAEIDAAVAAAKAAFPAWRKTPLPVRRALLLKVAELLVNHAAEFAALGTVDNGTPTVLTAGAAPLAADLFAYNAGWSDKIGGEVVPAYASPSFDYTMDEPYGVVGVIIPWNGPLISCGMILAPALAAGNCVVLKPPELAPYSALRLGELVLEAGFPPGVVNVVPAGPVGGEALVRHKDVEKVHFTGSGATAQNVLASALRTLKPVGLELGGKSANIIFEDADLTAAAQGALTGIFQLSGQGCINGTRVLVQRSVHAQVVELIAQIAAQAPIGDPQDPSVFIGPVVNATACKRIMGVIDSARHSGARLVAGGERMSGDYAGGYFIQPTVFDDVDPASSLAQHEVFGPVLAVIPFDDEAEAVRIANDTDFGLAAYVQTNDLKRAHCVAAELVAGNVWVNGFMGIPGTAPFGGTKQSGYGRLGGVWGIREFTRPKNVWIALG
jgi:acyl-CoA reductase-like NAD-dependent aldehyde dehydrogenase